MIVLIFHYKINVIIMFQIENTALGIFFCGQKCPKYTTLHSVVYIEFMYAVTALANDYLTI